MVSNSSMQDRFRHWWCLAGSVVIGAWASFPANAQDPISPPTATHQPIDHPAASGPAPAQAKGGAAGSGNVWEQLTRAAEEREAAADELAKMQIWVREKSKESELERQFGQEKAR